MTADSIAAVPDVHHELLLVSRTQRANLRKLATFLAALPADYSHFSMTWFFESADSSSEDDMPAHISPKQYNACGTVACAVGHGPAAGVRPYRDLSWWDYAHRAFGAQVNSYLWYWLFDGGWSAVDMDNTPQGAARRIFYALANGVPSGDSHRHISRLLSAQGSGEMSDETLQAAQPEGQEPGPKDAPNPREDASAVGKAETPNPNQDPSHV